jgi:hypothetical protein
MGWLGQSGCAVRLVVARQVSVGSLTHLSTGVVCNSREGSAFTPDGGVNTAVAAAEDFWGFRAVLGWLGQSSCVGCKAADDCLSVDAFTHLTTRLVCDTRVPNTPCYC